MKVTPGFGRRIESLVEAAGSPNKLSAATGIAANTIRNWMREAGMQPKLVANFVERAGVSVDWLYTGAGEDAREVEKFHAAHPEREPEPIRRVRAAQEIETLMLEDAPPACGRGVADLSHLSELLLVNIIAELSDKPISADERLRLVAPYQSELARRVRTRSRTPVTYPNK